MNFSHVVIYLRRAFSIPSDATLNALLAFPHFTPSHLSLAVDCEATLNADDFTFEIANGCNDFELAEGLEHKSEVYS
jgi:hypothetical protein